MKKILTLLAVVILILSGFGASAISEKERKTISPSPYMGEFDMVIIAPELFSESLQPLIDHKNSHGVQTFLKKTEEIYGEFDGRDKAEQVKYFIKDAIEQWNITFVLLVGGRRGQLFRWHVPVRYSNNNYHLQDNDFYHKKFLSDLYFADIYKENGLFEDWDSDGDGVFAEWVDNGPPEDSIDLVPDVCLGRLPCRSKEEVNIIVDKIIHYENNAYGQEWLNNILLVGGDSFPGIGDPFPYEGEVSCDWVMQYLEGFIPTKLYTSDGTLTGPDDFISTFNNGYGFVLFHGHGKQYKIYTYMPDSQEIISVFHNNYFKMLQNGDMLPVMVVGCCLTTAFDVGVLNFLTILKNFKKYVHFFDFIDGCVIDSFGWNMVKKSDGGSIAYIGSSSTGYLTVGDTNNDDIPDLVQTGYTTGLCNEFFRIFDNDENKILGKIYSDALSFVIENHSAQSDWGQCKCVQEFQLIGDPSLKIGGYP